MNSNKCDEIEYMVLKDKEVRVKSEIVTLE